MKTRSAFIIVMQFFLLHSVVFSQIQWYQNQDGNNLPPNGTVGTSIQWLTRSSFIACYQWNVNNDQVTWKVSKSDVSGNELATFFVSGLTAQAQVKVGHNTVYVLEQNFQFGGNTIYTVYKLDTSLNILLQKNIEFPGDFAVFNMNAFEIDRNENIYLAGDGQFPIGFGFSPASFVLKTDKNLNTQWRRIDSVQTSYTQLRIERNGNINVVEDFYSFFPDFHLKKLSPSGNLLNSKNITGDPGRYTLSSLLDNDDNLIFYGGKFIGDTAQGVFLTKVSRSYDNVPYNKTLFTSVATQLYDLKLDNHGNIFSLVSQFSSSNNQYRKISRISAGSGNIKWTRTFDYATDSLNLVKLVVTDNDRFYAVGEKKYHNILSKGIAVSIRKSGLTSQRLIAPDSVAFERSHCLTDGILDWNNQLISIGCTNDLDTITFQSSYFRAFALKFGAQNHCDHNGITQNAAAETNAAAEETTLNSKLVIFPNPAQNQLTVANLSPTEYDRLSVYNLSGALQQEQVINNSSERVNVSKLASGVYVLVLKSTATLKSQSIRFVVSK